MLSDFFQLGPLPLIQIQGTYNHYLVLLSYLVATGASYIALDITGRLRDPDNTQLSTTLWMIGGAFAMGAGIWAMHFIGMLSFNMGMPMTYDSFWTGLSILVAILASGFTFFLLKSKHLTIPQLGLGGIVLGFGIVSMHYLGMQAMTICSTIHYLPMLFILSIIIAIVASEVALWLAIKSNQGALRQRIRLKVISAFIMGGAIVGMHYTGMAAAVFTPMSCLSVGNTINPQILSICIALVTFIILAIAFVVSTHKEMMNYRVITLAHQEGMAQVSANVLHNVGNVLNSINVAATLVSDRVSDSELAGLKGISTALEKHKNNLGDFITKDTQGSQLPGYIKMLTEYWEKEQIAITDTMKKLMNNIQHIKYVINLQKSNSIKTGLEQLVSIEELLDESLAISNIMGSQSDIKIEKYYGDIKPFIVDKLKLIQIFINLVSNGKHALIDSSIKNKLLILRTNINDQGNIIIQIIDNGIGIAPENLSHLFVHGFTTRKEGHGFGLHASAIAIKEMKGEIRAHSEGIGKGATFTIEFPYTLPKNQF